MFIGRSRLSRKFRLKLRDKTANEIAKKIATISLFLLTNFAFSVPVQAGEAESSDSPAFPASSSQSSQPSLILVTPVLKETADKRLTEFKCRKKLSLAPSEALCFFLGERIVQRTVDQPFLCESVVVAESEVYIQARARAQGAPTKSVFSRHFWEGDNHGIVSFIVEVKPKAIEDSVFADADVPVLKLVAAGAVDTSKASQIRAGFKPRECERIGIAEVCSQDCQGKNQKYYEPHGSDKIAFTSQCKISLGSGRMLRWYKPLVELASNNPVCLDTVIPAGADGKFFLLAQKTGKATVCAKDVDGEYVVLHIDVNDEDLAADIDKPAGSQAQAENLPDIDRPALAYGIWMKGYNYKISKASAAKVVSNQDLCRVIVPDPSMARVTLLNPRAFLIEPLRPGATTIFVSDTQGKHARVKLDVLESDSAALPLPQFSTGPARKKTKPVEIELWEGELKDVLKF